MGRLENSKRASKASNGSGLGMGRFTRRIDFQMHRRDTNSPCIETTAKIIRLLHEIYDNSNLRNTPMLARMQPKVMQELVSCCGKNLRRIEWNLSECPALMDLAELLAGTPNLETLSLFTMYGVNQYLFLRVR